MKLLVFLLFLLPLWAEAQLMEPLDRWGIRTAYTHTNSSKSFVFVGASLNSIDVDYIYFAFHFLNVLFATSYNSKDNWKIIPEIGADAFFILPVGAGVSVNTEAITPRVGITLLNTIEFYWGYSIPFKGDSYFRGRTFSVIVNLFSGL
jgi:hypothetical protein